MFHQTTQAIIKNASLRQKGRKNNKDTLPCSHLPLPPPLKCFIRFSVKNKSNSSSSAHFCNNFYKHFKLRLFYSTQNKEFRFLKVIRSFIYLFQLFYCVIFHENLSFIWWILKDFKMLTPQSQGTPNSDSILFDWKMLMKMAASTEQHLAHYNVQF